MSMYSVTACMLSKGIIPMQKMFGEKTVLAFTHNGKQHTQIYDKLGKLVKYKWVDGEKVVKGTIDRSVDGTRIEKVTKSPSFTDVSIINTSKVSEGKYISRVNNNESVFISATRDHSDNLLVDISKTQNGIEFPIQSHVIDNITGKKVLKDDVVDFTDNFFNDTNFDIYRQNILDNYQISTYTNNIATQELYKSNDFGKGVLELLGLGALFSGGGLMFKPKAPKGYTVKKLIGDRYSVAVNNGNFGAKVMSANEYKNWLKQVEGAKV